MTESSGTSTQAGSTYVLVKPSFAGFQKQIDSAAVRAGATGGAKLGKSFSDNAARSAGDLRKLGAQVGKARDAEATAAGKVRVAEASLTEARKKGSAESTKVIAAEERLSKAKRDHAAATDRTKIATNDYAGAQDAAKNASDRAEKSVGRLSGTLGRAKSEAAGFVKQYGALGALAGLAGGVKVLGDSVRAASEAEQAVGAVDSVFGKHAGNVKKNAETAATSLGLTKTEYMSLSTVLASGLKNKGIKDFAGQSQNLVKLGADLSAMYGGSTKEAVEALGSAMRGEMDPIERYGVTLSAEAVKAEAMSLGLVKNVKNLGQIKAAQNTATVAQNKYNEAVKKYGKDSDQARSAEAGLIRAKQGLSKAMAGNKTELTNEQKAMATLSLTTKQTKDAQGAFGRESGTLAGQQQRLTALWGDLKVQLGTGLLPILTRVTSGLVGFAKDFKNSEGAAGTLRGVLAGLVGTLGAVWGFLVRNRTMLGALAVTVGVGVVAWKAYQVATMVSTLWMARATIAQTLLNRAMLMNPVGLIVAGLVVLGAGLVLAWKKSETFRTIVTGAWNGIRAAAGAVVGWWQSTAWPILSDVLGWIGGKFSWLWKNVIQPVLGWIGAAAGGLFAWFRDTGWPVIKAVLGWIGGAFSWLWRSVVSPVFTWVGDKIGGFASWFRDTVWPIVKAVLGWWGSQFSGLWEKVVKPVFTWIGEKISAFAGWFRDNAWPIISRVLGWFGDKINWLWEKVVKPVFTWIGDKIGGFASWFRDTAWPIIRDAFQWVGDKAGWLKAKAIDPAFDGIKKAAKTVSDAFDAAQKAIGKAWDKIKSAVGKPINAVIRFSNKLISGVNALLPGDDIKHIPLLPGYDRGGWTGPGSRMTPAGIVHADEFVLSKAARRSLEAQAPGALDAMNRTGRWPGYASGGRVSGHSWPSIWDYVRTSFPGVRMTSNYRPGARSLAGPVSSHALGSAIDIAGPVGLIKQVMSHMAAKFGGAMRDLIYSPLWGGRMIYNGKWINAPAVTQRTHSNHGHIGLMPGRTLSGSPLAGSAQATGLFDGLKDSAAKAIAGVVGANPGNPWTRIPVRLMQGALGKIVSLAESKMPWTDVKGQGTLGSGAVTQVWTGLVQRALKMVGQPLSLVPTVLRRMNQESSGNARAINNWDSNARRGTPSKGLMQVIDPTFRRYAMPGYNTNIWDPLSNILASMRYALARYGSLAAAYNRPGGYMDGGYTGRGARSAVAGLVHRGEMVFESEAVRRLGLSNLELLRQGAATIVPATSQRRTDFNWSDPGPRALGGTSSVTTSGGDTYAVTVNVNVDDLARMSTVADFVDGLKSQRLNARRVTRSGYTVEAGVY